MGSLTHQYIPRILQREGNLFVEEYFSGTDTKIYIAGEEQKEVSYIQYSVNEQLKPIYGYNSRTFDDVSVGTRIVTGVLKVPIKNTAEQSSKEDVESGKSTMDLIEEYNSNENVSADNTEWVTKENGSGAVSSGSNEVFEYQSKLAALGYTVSDSGLTDTITIKAIKEFQGYIGVTVDGKLSTETKKAIDEAIELSNIDIKYIVADTVLYSGPAESFGSLGPLSANSRVYVIDTSFDDFVMVNTLDGKTGYVRKEFIGE